MRDDGMVYVRTNSCGDKREVYHTSEDCRYYDAENVREWPMTTAKAFGMTECSDCAGTHEETVEADYGYYDAIANADPEEVP